MNTIPRTLDADTVAHLQAWVGRTETLTDELNAAPVRGLSATLDRDDPAPGPGTVLPPLWHWLYFSTGKARSARTAMRSAAVSCRRCRCPGACGPADV